ncbi:MAG: hypothetical protein ABSB74_10035 [Tepidisphaeraceae bacterium]
MQKLQKKMAPYLGKSYPTDSPELAEFNRLSAEYDAIGSERRMPDTPDTVEQLLREIRRVRLLTRTTIAETWQGKTLRKYHRRAEALGVPLAKLPALPTGETKGRDEMEAWLIEFEKAICDDGKPLAGNAKPATRARVRPTDAEVDALLTKLGLNGDAHQPHNWHEFTQRTIGANNLKNALCKDEISASKKRGDHGENLYLVRTVVRRFFPKFQS